MNFLLDPEDSARLAGRSLYLGQNGYAYFSTAAAGPVTVHSFVMGGTRPGHHIDHINGDKLDNRKANLRFVSTQTNQVNRKRLNRNNSSGVRGVTVRSSGPRPYIAQIMVNHRLVYLGSFATLAEAAAERKAAEIMYFEEACP